MYKILVVDDMQENIDILHNALHGKYKIYAAKDGSLGFDVAKKVKPDLILLDIVMPNLDGYAVIQLLKNDPILKEIPVIFITAQSTLSEKTMGFELGAVDYIVKPFDVQEVNARVETHLALMQSRKDVQDMLSKTLVGAINVFMEIEKQSHPTLLKLSNELRTTASEMARVVEYQDMWMIDVGSLLALTGLLYLSPQSLDGLLRGVSNSKRDLDMFEAFPMNSSALIKKIPRLEKISQMIEGLHVKTTGKTYQRKDEIKAGTQILQVAYNYEIGKMRGRDHKYLIKTMQLDKERYAGELIEALLWIKRDKL